MAKHKKIERIRPERKHFSESVKVHNDAGNATVITINRIDDYQMTIHDAGYEVKVQSPRGRIKFYFGDRGLYRLESLFRAATRLS